MKLKIALLIGLCIGLSACFGGRSADPNFYTLTPVSEKSISDKQLSIGINRVQVARYLDRPQIVTQQEDTTEVSLSEMNRWMEPLSGLIARTLTADLEKALPNSTIKTRSIGQENFDYIISLEIVSMDTVFNKTATLNAWWMIYDKNEKLLSRHQTVKTLKVGNTYEDLATTQSRLIGELAVQISQKLVAL